MKKEEIFFGQSGLTSTSANHIANLAKERVASIQKKLESISFVNEYISIVGVSDKTQVSQGFSLDELNGVENDIEQIALAHSLIAWLREAIKAREKLVSEVERLTLGEWCLSNGIEKPVEPSRECDKSKDDYIAEMNVGERCRMLRIEAITTAFGKLIHPNGHIAEARDDAHSKSKKSFKVNGSGRDTIIYQFEPSVSEEDIDKIFFELQNRYRSLQAESNGISHALDMKAKEYNLKVSNEYAKAYSEYTNKVNELKTKFEDWKLAELMRIESLKIIVPSQLSGIYNEVSALGKTE